MLAAQAGRIDAAFDAANDAIEMLGENSAGQASAYFARGLAQARRDQLAEAVASFAAALERLERAHMFREAGIVAQEQAKALRAIGDLDGAERVLARAEEIAAR